MNTLYEYLRDCMKAVCMYVYECVYQNMCMNECIKSANVFMKSRNENFVFVHPRFLQGGRNLVPNLERKEKHHRIKARRAAGTRLLLPYIRLAYIRID